MSDLLQPGPTTPPQARKTSPAQRVVRVFLVVVIIAAGSLWLFQQTKSNRVRQSVAETLTVKAMFSPTPTTVILRPTATPLPLQIVVWEPYVAGSSEAIAFSRVLDRAYKAFPELQIAVQAVPADEIVANFQREVAAGRGPDLLLAPNDQLAEAVGAGLVAEVGTLASDQLDSYAQASLEAMTVDDRLYGIPASFRTVAFWYDKTRLPVPPQTTSELKSLMAGGTPVGLSYSCDYYYGFFGTFGGRIFDDSWQVVAHQERGTLEALTYIKSLYDLSRANDWPLMEAGEPGPFMDGQVAATINGTWFLNDFKQALGENLAVAPLPGGLGGPATPLLGVNGYYLNPNSQAKAEAVRLALFLTNTASQEDMMDMVGHLPVRADVPVTDALIQTLLTALKNGAVLLQAPQMRLYWDNFCDPDAIFQDNLPIATWLVQAAVRANQ